MVDLLHDAIQKQLLAEPKLTYKKVVELAQSPGTAAHNIQEIKSIGEGNPRKSTRL